MNVKGPSGEEVYDYNRATVTWRRTSTPHTSSGTHPVCAYSSNALSVL